MIPAKTMEKLEERMIRFLKIVKKHNLCFKRSKYNFSMEEILNSRSSGWERTSANGNRQSQGSQRMEDPHQDKRSRKLLGVCKFLQIVYQEL